MFQAVDLEEFYGCSDVMFSCSKSGRYVPRAILAGSPARMDVASQAHIFDAASMVNSPESLGITLY